VYHGFRTVEQETACCRQDRPPTSRALCADSSLEYQNYAVVVAARYLASLDVFHKRATLINDQRTAGWKQLQAPLTRIGFRELTPVVVI
jgi:hypothetical protein